MPRQRILEMPFARVYPLLVQKAERKGRTKAEVDELITWLTGYPDPEACAELPCGDYYAKAPCRKCGEVIESTDTHEFKSKRSDE